MVKLINTCKWNIPYVISQILACTNGEVKLEEDGTPLVLWDDRWSPICGHFFWDNQVGASMFCSKLGYGQGEQSGSGKSYSSDAFRIGKCEEGDDWNSHCTGGCNDYELGGTCGNSMFGSSCATDDNVGITITCSQPSNVVFNPSCTGTNGHYIWTNYCQYVILILKIIALN